MERTTLRLGRHGRRLVGGALAALLIISACGNGGGTTPNTNSNNGNAGNGNPSASETVPPDIPRNLK